MKKLFAKFLMRADEALGTYEAFEVISDQDLQACMAVMERVRREELNRMAGKSAMESSAFVDRHVEDRLFAVRHARSGEIVGCVRGLNAAQLKDVPASRLEYGLDLIPDALLERAAVATRLVMLPEHRRTTASLRLLMCFHEAGVKNNYELCLLACEPGLYSLYLKLGFRPLGRCHPSPTGGFRIPMVMTIHDIDHLRAVDSPLLGVAERLGHNPTSPALAWYRGLQAAGEAIDPGISAYRPSQDEEVPVHAALTRGMSEAGVAGLMRNALVVPCALGQKVVRDGDGGRQIGIVAEGLLEVVVDDRVVAMLGDGDVFGEIAFTLEGRRTAELRAATPDTQVLLLSQRSVDRIEDPKDGVAFWKNVAELLARRLAATTRRLGASNAGEGAA